MNRPIYFRGGNCFLSNFYACRINAWGHVFNTVEAAHMYRKCIFYGDVETAEKMLATRTGLQAKYLSKTIREKEHLRVQWNKQRRSVMNALVAIKFHDTTQTIVRHTSIAVNGMREKQERILEHVHLHWTAWTERVGSDTRELSRVRSKKPGDGNACSSTTPRR